MTEPRPVRFGTRVVLVAGFGAVLALMVAAAADSLRVLAESQARNDEIHRDFLHRVRSLDQIRGGLLRSGNVVRDYLLPVDAPATRAAAIVLSNFFGDPFYSELRTKQQLGYIVSGGAAASIRQRYFTFMIQSSGYAPDELRRRAEAFIAGLPEAFAKISEAEWTTLIAGARSRFEEKPKGIREKAEIFFGRAFTADGEWDRQPASLAALDALTKDQALAVLRAALAPASASSRTILLSSKNHQATEAPKPTFIDRDAWKPTRHFN